MTAEELQALAEYIAGAQASAIAGREMVLGELCFIVKRESLRDFMKFLKTDAKCQFTQLMDLCGADYTDRGHERFDVVYNLLSMPLNQRIRVKVRTSEGVAVDSITDIFSAAGWYEREAWDLFGILFTGNLDLRRILTDYGFEGHPLRKDFPLTGFVEIRYDEEQKRIVTEPVKLQQDFRTFDFVSPWEGMTTVQLPGDEKARKPKVGGK
jgi:NADH-quinone oxidoreductase subunit C